MSTTREEWLALAERIEKATEPNREIDARISVAVGDVVMRFLKVSGKWAFWTTPVEPNQCASLSNVSGNEDDAFRSLGNYKIAPRYTGSLDVITELIERELPGHSWAVLKREIGTKVMLDQFPAKDKSLALRQERTAIYANAETPAVALCMVFCRAMAERVPSASSLKGENNV
jgi:hypothetical protein